MTDIRRDDRRLAKSLKRGKQDGWSDFYEVYAEALYRFVLARVQGKRETAEELTHEAIVLCVEQIDKFDARKGSLWAWLCGIAVNKIRENGRAASREDNALREMARGSPTACDPSDIDEGGERLVEMVLSSLSPGHQEVLRAKYIDGLSVKSIAASLDVSEKAVESRLTRSRDAFRREHEKLRPRET